MPRLLLLLLVLMAGSAAAQRAFTFLAAPGGGPAMAGTYVRTTLDLDGFRTALRAKAASLELPLPAGGFATFTVTEDPVFAPALAARYPQISSYAVVGPWGRGRLAISHKGVDALLPGPDGTFAIQPAAGGREHLVFYSREYDGAGYTTTLACGYDPADPLVTAHLPEGAKGDTKRAATRDLRQYDLALTNTGEFASRVGGTKADVLAAYNTAVTTINAIFEREVGVRMNLLALSEDLIYLDADTDPFTDSDEGTGLLDQVIGAFQDNDVPASAYDLGHVLTSRCVDVGGVVSGLACSGSKTRGVTCLQGDDVARTAERIMAHEIAHQFTVSHSWNNCPPSAGQRAGNTAFEPGSGTTIMSYAGACGDQNIGAEDAYYHVGNLDQFIEYTRAGGAAGCATIIEAGNDTPEVILDYADGFHIPKSTPFRLTGRATDANDPAEQLTYNWEQYDLGPEVSITNPRGNAPLFRSVPPAADGFTRYFPRVDRVANNISANDEVLPDYARGLSFRLTARDNNADAGAYGYGQVNFEVADVGPFVVNQPLAAGADPWRVGEYREVTWDPAGTAGFPVNAAAVNILLSEDGGLTFDRVLVARTANTGSAFVNVPDVTGESMRVVIEAADNVFYNMHAEDFAIAEAREATYTLDYDLRYAGVCLPEVLQATFTVGSVLDFQQPVTLAVVQEELPDGLTAAFDQQTVLPGQTAELTVDLRNVVASGRLVVPVEVSTEGRETSRREIVLDVVANDFSDLQLAAPAEGTEGITLSTDFTWTEAVNADSYDLQVATSPSFAPGTLLADASDLTDTAFTPEEFFAANTVYFWRVRPVNACGPGPWTETASFHTVSSQCDTYASTDTPVLPGSGGSFTRESRLQVDRRGTINDLNLPNVNVNYQFASKVTLTLTSPAGTSVVLYREKCFSTNTINLGFDDEAPDAVACPPDDQRVFQPAEALAAFDGEDTFGEWVLTVAVSETNGAAGKVVGWNVEFCADAAAPTPDLLVNDSTEVRPLGRNPVLRADLEIVTDRDAAADTRYLLTRMPVRGTLELNGTPLALGDAFTQADINATRLIYQNEDDSLPADDFGFVVTTASGGYLPVTSHGIAITADATVPVRGPEGTIGGLSVFPNPATADLQVRWTARPGTDVSLQLFDLNGRELLRRTVSPTAGQAQLDLSALAPGVYLLRLGDAVRRVVRH